MHGTDRDPRNIPGSGCPGRGVSVDRHPNPAHQCPAGRGPGYAPQESGLVEYVLAVANTGSRPLTIHDVKLLNAAGRYLASAASYEQVIAPPNAGGRVAATTAGAAVGQIIPFGGAIVGIISEAVSASTAESRESAGRAFERHKLKAVELAPAGKMTGSAFLPDIPANEAKALVVSYGHGNQSRRIEIRLSHRKS